MPVSGQGTAELPRRNVIAGFEEPGKIEDIADPAHFRHGADRHQRFFQQQPYRELEPLLNQELLRRQAGETFEQPAEMDLRDAAQLRLGLKIPFLRRRVADLGEQVGEKMFLPDGKVRRAGVELIELQQQIFKKQHGARRNHFRLAHQGQNLRHGRQELLRLLHRNQRRIARRIHQAGVDIVLTARTLRTDEIVRPGFSGRTAVFIIMPRRGEKSMRPLCRIGDAVIDLQGETPGMIILDPIEDRFPPMHDSMLRIAVPQYKSLSGKKVHFVQITVAFLHFYFNRHMIIIVQINQMSSGKSDESF